MVVICHPKQSSLHDCDTAKIGDLGGPHISVVENASLL